MSENIELPEIRVSLKNFLNNYFVTFNDNFIKDKIRDNAGIFFHNTNTTILFYGEFTESLLKKYNRTIEKQACKTISHEIIHWWILKELNVKACARFDDIAESLAEYGVY